MAKTRNTLINVSSVRFLLRRPPPARFVLRRPPPASSSFRNGAHRGRLRRQNYTRHFPRGGVVVDGAVGVLDGDVLDGHVGREEGLQGVDPVAGQPVEGVAHGASVGVLLVPDSTVRSRVGAPSRLRRLRNLK